MSNKVWPYLLALAGLVLLWLDRPLGLRYVGSNRRGGWTAEGWALGSPWITVIGICAVAMAVVQIVVRVTSKRS